jgi:hypothetical protein
VDRCISGRIGQEPECRIVPCTAGFRNPVVVVAAVLILVVVKVAAVVPAAESPLLCR